MASFDAQVNDFVRMTQKRVRAVVAKATLGVFNDAQIPIKQGGNMPVKDGFLRNSGRVNYDGKVIAQGGEGAGSVQLTIQQGSSGSLFGRTGEPDVSIEWGAEYAIYQENINGFLRLASVGWAARVAQASRDLEATINARRR